MSHGQFHSDQAFALLAQLPPLHEMSVAASFEITGAASVHALLAVEHRLGEIAAQQKLANTIAAFQSGAIGGGADFATAYATVRALLGLTDTSEGNRA